MLKILNPNKVLSLVNHMTCYGAQHNFVCLPPASWRNDKSLTPCRCHMFQPVRLRTIWGSFRKKHRTVQAVELQESTPTPAGAESQLPGEDAEESEEVEDIAEAGVRRPN